MAKDIDLSKYTSLRTTKKKLEELENKETRKEILRYYGPKTGKKINKITWKVLADRVFSEYVRLYYADEKGYVRCITSGVKMPWYKAQNGHFISRAVNKYRFDINNCYPQSYRDNCILGGNYKIYTIKMIELHGKEKVLAMLNDNEKKEYRQERYEKNILERYTFITDKKEQIGEMSKESDTDLESMEF